MEFYMSPRRNGTSVRLPITGMTITREGKPKSRVRYGKTERDHKSGAWRQRLANRAARNQKD